MRPESLEAFRAEAVGFLDAHAPRRPDDRPGFEWGVGDDWDVALWEEPDRAAERANLEAARRWRALRFDAGFGWVDGPAECGGRGLPAAYERLYQTLERDYVVPDQAFFKLARILGPLFLEHASDEVKERYVRALFRGDSLACELFSEPDAGSDLASLRSTAVRDGDGWVLQGQKVWTSDAHFADLGLMLCRTDPGVPKHQGITAFVVDMTSPGVEVRPLRQMTGGSAFNEVFVDGVAVPDSHRVGEPGTGWRVAQETLRLERAAIGAGIGRSGSGIANCTRLIALARAVGRTDDPVIRQALARVYTGFRVARATQMVSAARRRAGLPEGPPPMLAKLALSHNLRSASELVSALLGPRLIADGGEWGTYAWSSFVLGEPGMHIMAGTDEIIRNVLAERVLGLPRDELRA